MSRLAINLRSEVSNPLGSVVSTMFCKAKSAKHYFFCAAILDHIPTKMFNSETTSFQHFSPRIQNLKIFWTSDFGKWGQNRPQNIPLEKGHWTDTQTDIATTRSNQPSGPIRWKEKKKKPWVCEKSVMALWGVLCGSDRSLSGWLAPWAICYGSGRNQSPVETVLYFYWQNSTLTNFSQRYDRLLAEPWRTPGRAMTDSWPSHDGLLVEPWQTFHRHRGLIFRFHKLKKKNKMTIN